jgi:hypothetical protein
MRYGEAYSTEQLISFNDVLHDCRRWRAGCSATAPEVEMFESLPLSKTWSVHYLLIRSSYWLVESIFTPFIFSVHATDLNQ